MTGLRLFCALAAISAGCPAMAQSWAPQMSNTTAALRGISVISPMAAWASGAKGVFVRTTDGGAKWTPGVVPGAADADFRAVHAFSDTSALLISSGAGPLSRLYQTEDGGVHWDLVMVNPDPVGFWDAIAMWDTQHGILLGDPVKGRFVIWTTSDGATWQQVKKGPPALAGETLFAASNSSLFVRGEHEAWFGTGGVNGGRVFHTEDGGMTWTVAKTPILHSSSSAGIFSVAFAGSRNGVAVGGDFNGPSAGSAVFTSDGGKTWAPAATPPAGYRSAVAYVEAEKMWVAVGPTGSDVSLDNGRTWKQFDSAGYNALAFFGSTGFAVGPNGAIARFRAR